MIDGEIDVSEGVDTGNDMDPENTAFLSALSDEDKAFASENGWRGVGNVLESYRSLQEQLSGSLTVPDKTASAEAKAAFYADISRNWTPKEGYQFKLPDALPENFPYDQSFAEEAGGWFQEAGLHPDAAQALHDRWVGKMAEQFASHEETAREASLKQTETAEAAHLALVKEYGEPDSDSYQNVVAKADRAISGLKSAGVDLTNWFSEKGALTEAGKDGLQKVIDPVAVKLLAFVHDSAFAEDGLSGLGEGPGGANPFDKGNPNLRLQSELLESNPARARQLIVSAGRDPRMFGL
ncbi:hypothetical protein CLV41_10823 [Roseibium marinum]|uniref:Uncharacterized protein n=2 Tax=Roseibium marinum TaxID=281252 RepID=A0A2S3UPT8_9HYPH|nr:hypothetical protein CLV41_10823 [Roseibium marinum]